MKNLTQIIFFGIISMIFVVVLLLSNISASNVINIGDFISLSAAEILFPLSYVVSDLLTEFYGQKIANKVMIVGLVLVLFATICLALTALLPTGYAEYETVFGSFSGGIIGITLASFIAFFCGTILNNFVFDKLKRKDKNKKFFKRAILSSVIAELADSLVFITFCCIFASQFYLWTRFFQFVLTITTIKLVVEILVFPLTNYIKNKAYQKKWVENNQEHLQK